MERRAFGHSDVGMVRDHNEDTFLIDKLLGLYIVCDGLGGHAAGEVASKMACEVTQRVIKENFKVLKAYIDQPNFYNRARAITIVELAIETASREVYAMSQTDPTKRGMASTIALLQIVGNNAILAHVGDSRIYLCRENEVHQLTKDHSLVNEKIERGLITAEEARDAGKCALMTRAVGYHQYLEVTTLHIETMPGDTFVLCSDGLSDLLIPDEICDLMEHAEIDALPEVLTELANSRGGYDNSTAVVVQIDPQAGSKDVQVARKVELLQKIPLFQHLQYPELCKVLTTVRVRDFDAGQMIITEGDTGNELYITLKGAVQISKDGQKLAQLSEGAFFGEMSLIDKQPRSADVVATVPSKMMLIKRTDFQRLLKSEPSLAVKLLWAFCHVLNDRLHETSEELSYVRTNAQFGSDVVPLEEVEVDLDDEMIEEVSDDE